MQPLLEQAVVEPTPTANHVHYERRRPEATTLYQLVQENAETFFAQVETETGAGLPDFVKDEFAAFHVCGIPADGFLRLPCQDSAHEKLAVFLSKGQVLLRASNKKRGQSRRVAR